MTQLSRQRRHNRASVHRTSVRQRAAAARPAHQHRYDTGKRRAWLLAAAEDHLATATEIAQAIPAPHGRQFNVHTIRSWINRVLDLAQQHRRRSSSRR